MMKSKGDIGREQGLERERERKGSRMGRNGMGRERKGGNGKKERGKGW